MKVGKIISVNLFDKMFIQPLHLLFITHRDRRVSFRLGGGGVHCPERRRREFSKGVRGHPSPENFENLSFWNR